MSRVSEKCIHLFFVSVVKFFNVMDVVNAYTAGRNLLLRPFLPQW